MHVVYMYSSTREVKMSEAIYDMEAYTKLTDSVISMIMESKKTELEEVCIILLNC